MDLFSYFIGSNGEALQDSFVLSVLNGKESGFYLEIGSSYPQKGNNTFLLETTYKWGGLSIENDALLVEQFKASRRNEVLLGDATKLDYEFELKSRNFPLQIDYLQLDIDPPQNTLLALKKLPLKMFRFSVITFEHDLYACEKNLTIKRDAAKILTENGYVCVVSNLQTIPKVESCDGEWKPFEDWWIDGKLLQNYNFGVFNNVRWLDIFSISRKLKIQMWNYAFGMKFKKMIKTWLRST